MTATDLIATYGTKDDFGTIANPSLDYQYGTDSNSNSFELELPNTASKIDANAFVYIEGTEFIGQVTSEEPAGDTIIYGGPTWHGLLNERVICPDSGQVYYTASGEANAALGAIISRLGLSAIMAASTTASGITISHQFRYTAGYDGIVKMLLEQDARLTGTVSGGKVVIGAVPLASWSESSDHLTLDIKVDYRPVNHLICLGSGEGVDRIRVDLYASTAGVISQTQTQTGENENAEVYDYTSADEATLISNGTDKLQGYIDAAVTISVKVDAATDFGVGDTVSGRDETTGMEASAKVTTKVVKIETGTTSVTYTCGGATGTSIADTRAGLSQEAINAINEAIGAATAANSKIQQFTGTDYPNPPYNKGDIFINTGTGVVYRANTSRSQS